MEQIILNDLHPVSYEHPFDKKALNALQKTRGIDFLVKKYYEIGVERILRIQFTGSNIRVSEKSLKDLHQIFKNVCEILYLPKIPDFYVSREYSIKGLTTGIDTPLVAINSECIDSMEEKELMYIFGHEIGHIKSSHVLYHTIGTFLPYVGNIVGQSTLGIGNILSMGLEIALYNWHRMSEYTADRAGLLACQDINSAITAIIKMAGMPKSYHDKIAVDEFISQAQEFKDFDYDNLNQVIKILSIMSLSQPWAVLRTAELLKWVESGEYDRILSGSYITCTEENFCCPNCGFKAVMKMNFCGKCGYNLKKSE